MIFVYLSHVAGDDRRLGVERLAERLQGVANRFLLRHVKDRS